MPRPRRTYQQIATLLVHIYRDRSAKRSADDDGDESSQYRLSYEQITGICGYPPSSDDMLQINKAANAQGFVVPHLWRRTVPKPEQDACAVMSHDDLRRSVAAGEAVSLTRRQVDNLLRGVKDPRTAAKLLADAVTGNNVLPLRSPKGEK